MWLILAKLLPSFIDPILNHLNKRLDRADSQEKHELERQIAIIEAQKQLGLAREGHFLGRLPVFLVAFSTGLYYSSVLLVSTITVDTTGRWRPAELPEDFKVWMSVVIGGMFAVGAASLFKR